MLPPPPPPSPSLDPLSLTPPLSCFCGTVRLPAELAEEDCEELCGDTRPRGKFRGETEAED